MRRAIGFFVLLLAIGAVGVVVGRSIAPPPRPPTRDQVETDVGLERVVADVNFNHTPLKEAVAALRQQTATNLVVKWRAVEAAGIDANAPVTLRLNKLPLRRVLELLCEDAGGGTVKLNARPREGTIVVSTADDNAAFAEMRLYDVRDLLAANVAFRMHLGPQPSVCFGGVALTGGGGGGAGATTQSLFAGSGGAGNAPDPEQQAIEDLSRIITDFVAPDMWRDNGGTVGSIREYNGRLMISATPDMHEEIAALLEMLRKGK
jgi:hypothetical protein